MSRLTRFRVTCYHYLDDNNIFYDLQEVNELKRYVHQEEKCPRTGRLHMQAYFETKQRYTFSQFQNILSNNGWSNPSTRSCEATPYANYQYCTKEDSSTGRFRFVRGEFTQPRSVRREELKSNRAALISDIKAGRSEHYIASNYANEYLQRSRGIPQLIRILGNTEAKSNRQSIGVLILSGSTGIGKSFWARQWAHFHRKSLYSLPMPTRAGATVWFDGYMGQEVLLIDDLGYDDNEKMLISRQDMLRILDTYKLQVQTKGGFVWALWKYVIITTNYYDVFQGDPALTRRITHEWSHCDSRDSLPDFREPINGREVPVFIDPPPLVPEVPFLIE